MSTVEAVPPVPSAPVTVIFKPSFTITATNGSMNVRVEAKPAPARKEARA